MWNDIWKTFLPPGWSLKRKWRWHWSGPVLRFIFGPSLGGPPRRAPSPAPTLLGVGPVLRFIPHRCRCPLLLSLLPKQELGLQEQKVDRKECHIWSLNSLLFKHVANVWFLSILSSYGHWTVGVMSQRPLLVLDMGSANDVHILSMIVWLCAHLGESPLTRLRAPGGRLLCHADPPSHTFSTKTTLSHFFNKKTNPLPLPVFGQNPSSFTHLLLFPTKYVAGWSWESKQCQCNVISATLHHSIVSQHITNPVKCFIHWGEDFAQLGSPTGWDWL